MNQRVRPKGRLPRSAIAIHGITRKMLKSCPQWPDVEAEARRLLVNRPVITYNAAFEVRLLRQTAERWQCDPIVIDSHCAMLAYAEHRGIRDSRRPGFKWHKLVAACAHEGIPFDNEHAALSDAQRARDLFYT